VSGQHVNLLHQKTTADDDDECEIADLPLALTINLSLQQ